MNISESLYNVGPKQLRQVFGTVMDTGSEVILRHNMSRLINKQSSMSAYYRENKASTDPKVLKKIKRNRDYSAKNLDDVRNKRRLITVAANSNNIELLKQLLRDEKVHKIVDDKEDITEEHIRELITNRLGLRDDSTGTEMNKDCQAFVVPTRKGPYALAQIFRYHAEVRVTNGQIDLRDLPGNIEAIVNSPATQLTGRENVTGYWTISSGWQKTGPVLVSELKTDNFEHTISPIRDLYNKVDREQVLAMDDDEIRLKVLDYLMNEPDSVKNFHLGNGAYVGWIHVNRDHATDWVIVNYVYDRENLERNQAIFKDDNIPLMPISGALYSILPPKMTRNTYNVNHHSLVSLPQLNAI